jgi:hypothetical protein
MILIRIRYGRKLTSLETKLEVLADFQTNTRLARSMAGRFDGSHLAWEEESRRGKNEDGLTRLGPRKKNNEITQRPEDLAWEEQ